MKQLIQITFTPKERLLLAKIIDVAGTFVMALHGDLGTDQDAENVQYLVEHPSEVSALIRKIGADKLECFDG